MVVCVARPLRAQVFIGPAASAAGSAGRAAIDPGETIYLNPAMVAFLEKYYASISTESASHPINGTSGGWGISLADGTAGTLLPGSLSFVRQIIDPPNGISDTQQDIQVNLAVRPFRSLAIGLTGHDQTDQILSNLGGAQYTQYGLHVGTLFTPTAAVGVGFVAYDVIPTGGGVPAPYHVQPTLAVGGSYSYEKVFRARLDMVRPDTQNPGQRINVGLGIESYFEETVAFRLGAFWKETVDQDYLSAGLGYIGPRLSLNYSFQQDIRNGGNYRHVIDLWLPL